MRRTFATDDDRLEYVKRMLMQSGERYLRDDFGAMSGAGELLETKKALARELVSGLRPVEDLDRVLDDGISVMRPHLDAAALELRRLSVNADRKMTPIGITGTPPGH